MRYVIHEHQKHGDPVHWDLMLEQGDVLKTFRLNCAPQQVLSKSCLATPIFDHDTRFLTYEGPVQKGLGQVKRVDCGTYESITLPKEIWIVTLKGTLFHVCIELPMQQQHPLIIVNIIK